MRLINKQEIVHNIKAMTANINIDTESMTVSLVYQHIVFEFHCKEKKTVRKQNWAKKLSASKWGMSGDRTRRENGAARIWKLGELSSLIEIILSLDGYREFIR